MKASICLLQSKDMESSPQGEVQLAFDSARNHWRIVGVGCSHKSGAPRRPIFKAACLTRCTSLRKLNLEVERRCSFASCGHSPMRKPGQSVGRLMAVHRPLPHLLMGLPDHRLSDRKRHRDGVGFIPKVDVNGRSHPSLFLKHHEDSVQIQNNGIVFFVSSVSHWYMADLPINAAISVFGGDTGPKMPL